MMLRFTIFFLLSMIMSRGYSAGEFSAAGPCAGMAFASVTSKDAWSASNNPAGLASLKSWQAGISMENNYLLKELTLKTLVLSVPVWKGTIGLNLQHLGFDLYAEIKAGLAFSMKMGKRITLGARLNYNRINQGEGYGSCNVLSFDAGVQFSAGNHLEVGVLIINPTAVKITPSSAERLPTLVSIGIEWKVIDGLKTVVEIDKDLKNKPSIRTGIEYRFRQLFFITTGLLVNPVSVTAGAGFAAGVLRIDLSCSYHPVLGYSPGISLSFGMR